MPILPLPVFEEDLKAYEAEKAAYDALKVPKTMVVRFGFMKLVGEFPYQGTEKPGCGSKIVVKTHRGTEIGEMLTSTCPNSGCSKSVSRKEMLEYIQNSGGRDYPFFEHGRALRVATPDDMQAQARIEQSKHALRQKAKAIAARVGFPAKIVEVEPILGGEQTSVYYHAEERIDLRDIAPALQQELGTRIDLRQVGARDEARLTADYERCGQYCCCKNFLKVLKPVSMKSAKIQKATLDPLKISGRCGRLMCCLRYEDQTYDELRKKLPRNKSRVGTPEGDGTVIDTQILTQLALVRLDIGDKDVAVPVEDLTPPISAEAPPPRAVVDTRPPRGPRPRQDGQPPQRSERPPARDQRESREESRRDAGPRRPRGPEAAPPPPQDARPPAPDSDDIDLSDIETDFGDGAPRPPAPGGDAPRRRKRRRRRGGGGGGNPGGGGSGGGDQPRPGA